MSFSSISITLLPRLKVKAARSLLKPLDANPSGLVDFAALCSVPEGRASVSCGNSNDLVSVEDDELEDAFRRTRCLPSSFTVLSLSVTEMILLASCNPGWRGGFLSIACVSSNSATPVFRNVFMMPGALLLGCDRVLAR